MNRFLTYTIEKEYQDKSVRQFLRDVPRLSDKQIRSLKFRENGILVNGVKTRTSCMLKTGDVLRLQLEPAGQVSRHLLPLDVPLDILYEDEDVLAVNKPVGILVHPSGGHFGDTLSNMAAAYFREKGEPTVIRSVGRLDKDTSGVLLFAKNKVTAAFLSSQREQGGFRKEYLALVSGTPIPSRGEISLPLRLCAKSPLKMTADPLAGKPARTLYQTESVLRDGNALLKVHILTGRTHQIRVHMASIGHPLLGDPLYGKKDGSPLSRTALHAARLEFYRPFSQEQIFIEAPLPKDFQEYLSGQ